MKKVLIVGAGPAGCGAAIAFCRIGWKVTVIEKFPKVTTRGAGILLNSNALKSLDELDMLDIVAEAGCSGEGFQPFYDRDSNLLGMVKQHSVDEKYPSYVGIDRRLFLQILYDQAVKLSAEFYFDTEAVDFDNNEKVSVVCSNGKTFDDYDLLVAADGVNSKIRNKFWHNAESVYSGFGLYHSTHPKHSKVIEKMAVFMPGKRFGAIPMADDMMYLWASVPQPVKKYIAMPDQPRAMYEDFKEVSGFLKEIIDELINDDPYVHYTSVEEVNINDKWHNNKIVLLGDSAHASTPFMAQGGAMSLQDACILSRLLSEERSLDDTLTLYAEKRKPVVMAVQQMSKNMGLSYNNTSIDLEKIQNNIDRFYLNDTYFA